MSIFVMPALLLLALALFGFGLRRRLLCLLPGGIALGALTYFFLGIGIARHLGVGRFYSVPFGWDRVLGGGDMLILASLTFWFAIWGAALYFLTRRRWRS